MRLYDYLKMDGGSYDSSDDVYDITVTVDLPFVEESSYDKFVINLCKKVDLIKKVDDIVIVVNWSKLIEQNLKLFREFSKKIGHGSTKMMMRNLFINGLGKFTTTWQGMYPTAFTTP